MSSCVSSQSDNFGIYVLFQCPLPFPYLTSGLLSEQSKNCGLYGQNGGSLLCIAVT